VGLSYGSKYDYKEYKLDTSDFHRMDEKIFRAGISLPLNFSRNIYTTTLIANAAYNYIFYEYPNDPLFGAGYKKEIEVLEIGLKFSNTQQMARRDINPRFGQLFNVVYWYTPFDAVNAKKSSTDVSQYFSDVFKYHRLLTNATLYFPGIFKHHSIALYGGYMKNSPEFRSGVYNLTYDNEFVRGYRRVDSDELLKGTVSYTLPIAYPDLALGPILYCKRFSLSPFYDYGVLRNRGYKDEIKSSIGIDFSANLNFFSIIFPFEMGLRSSYLVEENSFAFEFLFFGIAF
jgi:hypothetical protein